MKLLLANPNTTAAITARMAAAARTIASPGTEIIEATANFGAEVINTRAEMAIAEHASLALLASAAPGCNGVIIGASLDSALRAARTMLPCPVIGLTEAAIHTACLLGGRFGVLTTSATAATITREMIEAYGLASRLAGLRFLSVPSQYVLADPEGVAGSLVPLAHALIEDNLAETIVLIGAVMAGIPPLLQSRCPVPVIEGVTCAIPLLEGLVRLALPKPRSGTYAALPRRTVTGLDPALAARFDNDPATQQHG